MGNIAPTSDALIPILTFGNLFRGGAEFMFPFRNLDSQFAKYRPPRGLRYFLLSEFLIPAGHVSILPLQHGNSPAFNNVTDSPPGIEQAYFEGHEEFIGGCRAEL